MTTNMTTTSTDWQNRQCGEHYTGIIRALCEEGYAQCSDGVCETCDSPNVSLAVGMFFLLIAILAIVMFVLAFRVKAGVTTTLPPSASNLIVKW